VGEGLRAVQRQRHVRVAADTTVDRAAKAAEPRQRGDALLSKHCFFFRLVNFTWHRIRFVDLSWEK
jgi:hypothetical protein